MTCEFDLLNIRVPPRVSHSRYLLGHSLKMIQGLRGFMFYETFAYHVAALRQLINEKEEQKQKRQAGLVKGDMLNMSVHGSRVFSNAKKRTMDGSGSGKGKKFFSKDLDGSCKF